MALENENQLISNYLEWSFPLRRWAFKHRDWRIFMTNKQAADIREIQFEPQEQAPPIELTPELREVLDHHILIRDPATNPDDHLHCDHRWVLDADNTAKCLLCPQTRSLTDEEIKRIEEIERAGVVFVKWSKRLSELAKVEPKKRRQTRQKRRSKGSSKATGGVEAGDEIPKGFVSAKEAAQQMGIDAKKLRKMARSGAVKATKVGGRVYIQVPKKA